jgi:hypothetical protein
MRACGVETMDLCAGAAADYLADSLIGSQGRSSVEAIARRLPFALTTVFGFECHLNAAPHTDILFYVAPAGPGREVLAGLDPAHALPVSLFERPVWTRVRALGLAWATPGSVVAERVENIWLEFDVDDRSDVLPVPSVFVGFVRRLCPERDGASGAELAVQAHPGIVGTVLPLLLGHPLPTRTAGKLRDCFAALPPGSWLYGAGLMLARRSIAVRLCLSGLTAAQIPDYLRRIGWSGPSRELEAINAAISDAAYISMLNIDVAETIGQRIGLDYCVPWSAEPSLTVPLWKRVLDRLVDAGLCRAEQRDGLLAWPGLAPLARDGVLLPDPGGRLDARSLVAWDTLIRHIHHVKISLLPNGAIEVKAYLLCRRRERTWPETAELSRPERST